MVMKINILMVDDEVGFLETVSKRLKKSHLLKNVFDIYTAYDGFEAINLMKNQKFDLVILDVDMAGMDGIETLKLIKQKYPVVEVIMLTGHSKIEYATEGMRLGALDYLLKPLDFSELTNVIFKAILFSKEKLKANYSNYEYAKVTDILIESLIKDYNANEFQLINYNDYRIKYQEHLNKLRKNSNFIVYDMEQLIKNQEAGYNKKDILKVKQLQRLVTYCYILIEHYCNFFYLNKPYKSSTFNNIILNELLDIVFVDKKYNNIEIIKDYVHEHIIFDGGDIIRQILFIFFKNIADYLLFKEGFLNIATTQIHFSKETNEKSWSIELRFGINNTISSKTNILIVDRNDSLKELLPNSLNKEIYNVVSCVDGFECLDIFNSVEFSLIIINLQIICMSGFKLIETMRLNKSNMNTVILIYSDYDVINKPSFQETLSRFSPIHTLLRTKDEDILFKAIELLNEYNASFSFKDLFYLDIDQSIEKDNILRMGFYGVKRICEHFGIKVVFNGSYEDDKYVKLMFPQELMSNPTKNDNFDKNNDITIKNVNLNKLNNVVRHELKNKFTLIIDGLKEVEASSPFDLVKFFKDRILNKNANLNKLNGGVRHELKNKFILISDSLKEVAASVDLVESLKVKIFNCEQLLNDIKEIPII